MDCALKLTHFVLKVVDFVFKMMDCGRVLKDEIVIANAQAIDFHEGGPVSDWHLNR